MKNGSLFNHKNEIHSERFVSHHPSVVPSLWETDRYQSNWRVQDLCDKLGNLNDTCLFDLLSYTHHMLRTVCQTSTLHPVKHQISNVSCRQTCPFVLSRVALLTTSFLARRVTQHADDLVHHSVEFDMFLS